MAAGISLLSQGQVELTTTDDVTVSAKAAEILLAEGMAFTAQAGVAMDIGRDLELGVGGSIAATAAGSLRLTAEEATLAAGSGMTVSGETLSLSGKDSAELVTEGTGASPGTQTRHTTLVVLHELVS